MIIDSKGDKKETHGIRMSNSDKCKRYMSDVFQHLDIEGGVDIK